MSFVAPISKHSIRNRRTFFWHSKMITIILLPTVEGEIER